MDVNVKVTLGHCGRIHSTRNSQNMSDRLIVGSVVVVVGVSECYEYLTHKVHHGQFCCSETRLPFVALEASPGQFLPNKKGDRAFKHLMYRAEDATHVNNANLRGPCQ